MAAQLHSVFTDTWQRKIREAKTSEFLTAMYEKNFGDLYPTIKKFRQQIKDVRNRGEIIAYLVSDDPYKV